MGCNFSERSQKKNGEKKVPKEKVITRGEQTDRKKRKEDQTRRKEVEIKEREETNPTRTSNTVSVNYNVRKNMTQVHNFHKNYY